MANLPFMQISTTLTPVHVVTFVE